MDFLFSGYFGIEWTSFIVGLVVGSFLMVTIFRRLGRRNIELIEKLLNRPVGEIGARINLHKEKENLKPIRKPLRPPQATEPKERISPNMPKPPADLPKSVPSVLRTPSDTPKSPLLSKAPSDLGKHLADTPKVTIPTVKSVDHLDVLSRAHTDPDKRRSKRESGEIKNESNSVPLNVMSPQSTKKEVKKENGKSPKDTLKPEHKLEMKKSTDSLNMQSDSEKADKKKKKEGPTLVVFDDVKSVTSEAQTPSSVTTSQGKEKTIREGWMEIGTKVSQKLLWNRRYFVLAGGWLSYHKNEQKREDQCLGYINLSGCEVYKLISKKKEETKPKFSIYNKKHRIFHKHGPNSNTPPCSKKHYVFHKRSKKCRLRVADSKSLESWIEALKLAASEARSGAATPYDSEDDYDLDEMNAGVILPNSGSVHITGVPFLRSRTRVKDQVQDDFTDSELEDVNDVPLEDIFEQGHYQSTPPTPLLSDYDETSTEQTSTDDIQTTEESREGLMKLFTKAVGFDITTIALPVTLNEPVSFLQRMCEMVQFSDLLDKADQATTTVEAMMYVAAFVISMYQSVIRTLKPFNPYLGETFEFTKNNVRFCSEQVSHHPPVGASFADNEHFEFWQEQGLKTKFGGNSLACESIGRVNLKLKKSGHHFSWEAVKTVVHNIIIGSLWIDHYGDTEIRNYNTGETARLEFKKCGWFNKGRYEVNAWIVDSQGKTRIHLTGKWNESIRAIVVDGKDLALDKANLEKGPIWVNTSKSDPTNQWKLPFFCQELLELTPQMQAVLPVTDSRLRPDRIALQQNDTKRAASEKFKLEERERAKRRAREAKGEIWKPKYFLRREDDGHGFPDYQYNGLYWKEKQLLVQKYNNKEQLSNKEQSNK